MFKLCYVYVVYVFLVGCVVAREHSRKNSGNVQFTSAKRLTRHVHNHQSLENHHLNNHRESETRRHEQNSSGNIFRHYDDHRPKQNNLDPSDSGDRFQTATTIPRQNNDMNRHEHHSKDFNQHPTPSYVSFNKHQVSNENQQENYERLQHGHETDFNRHDLRNLPTARHGEDRQTGRYNTDNQYREHGGKESQTLEQPRGLHGQQFEHYPVNHHRQAGHPENQQETHHRNLPSDRHDQDRQTGRYNTDNQHLEHGGKESQTLEQPRGLHGQQFENNPVDHHRQAGHPENQHESQHRKQWNDRGGEQHHSYGNNQQFNATESNHFNLNHTQRHEVQREKDINEELVTERSSKEQLAQEENLHLNVTSTRSKITNTGSHLETNNEHTTTTPALTTTHKSNTTLPHPNLPNAVVLTAPDRACADGMAKDFTQRCRPVYQTDKAL